ncbi:MAG: hypothetical protein O3A00_11430 [Planctomycetota bacterium]|nr:hypothetical protein [Planctomycetota bacterium]
MSATPEPDASKFFDRKYRLRNRAIAAGVVGLLALGAMLMKGLPGFGGGSGDAGIPSTSKTTTEDDESKRQDADEVLTLWVKGEQYMLREKAGSTQSWSLIDLEKAKSMAGSAQGNEVGIRVRYYIGDTAIYDTVDQLRRALLQTVAPEEISVIEKDPKQ